MITEHSSRQADKKIKNREKLHAPHLEKGKRITWEFNSQDFNFLLFLFPPISTNQYSSSSSFLCHQRDGNNAPAPFVTKEFFLSIQNLFQVEYRNLELNVALFHMKTSEKDTLTKLQQQYMVHAKTACMFNSLYQGQCTILQKMISTTYFDGVLR